MADLTDFLNSCKHITKLTTRAIGHDTDFMQLKVYELFYVPLKLYSTVSITKSIVIYDYSESIMLNKDKIVHVASSYDDATAWSWADRDNITDQIRKLCQPKAISFTQLSDEQYIDLIYKNIQCVTMINTEVELQRKINLVEEL